ncbi:histone-lysine N-methyltransferase SETMAR [Trichonephila clavipes]|nr:histone-lysine N-methyltransferase SETMAR [Trichonephila clavipes]
MGTVDHPPYSPDLASSDFNLFRYLKVFLGGKRFDTADEVKEEVQDWLSSQAADVYDLGIQKLSERYDKCLNKYGKSGILLLDDNARPHSEAASQNHITTPGSKHLHHQLYNPKPAPIDFHLFLALKKNLAGRQFRSNIEVKQVLKPFLRMPSPEFFLEGVKKLIKRYDKCLNVLGTYVEKIKLPLICNVSFYVLTFIRNSDHSRQGKLIFRLTRVHGYGKHF